MKTNRLTSTRKHGFAARNFKHSSQQRLVEARLALFPVLLLKKILSATHDQDLGRKAHSTIGSVASEGFDDLALEVCDLLA
jgi:hypothetical protein